MRRLRQSLSLHLALVSITGGALAAAVENPPSITREPARFVNPFVGTDGHGHTFPGATVPFGMVQASPDTRLTGWDSCGGYHYSDRFIYGFSHTHLSGVGIPDYCDLLLAPQAGSGTFETPQPELGKPGYGSWFSHDNEVAEPGYYRVRLESQRLVTELSATTRVALHRYTFDDAGPAALLLDLQHRDQVLDSEIEVVSPTEIRGFRRSTGWAKDQVIYFSLQLENAAQSFDLEEDGKRIQGSRARGKNLKLLLHVTPSASKVLQVKMALSPTGTAGAEANLAAEIPGWDFETVRSAARDRWNEKLSRVQAESTNETDLRIFYTSLYHAYVCPNRFDDANGDYVGRDGKRHRSEKGYYTVFSLWDTYRAWHPLMTLLEPGTTDAFIDTFLRQYRQGGLLPVWDLAGNETFCMNGYHAVSVIADAQSKGLGTFRADEALEAAITSATRDHFGLQAYRQKGYIGREDGIEGVSRTLEYAYDDWCISRLAEAAARHDVRDTFLARSQNYRNLFSTRDRFFRARDNGGWYQPFDPKEINFNYTEGNAWQYRFMAPHDVNGLIQLMGGDRAFEKALDDLFQEDSTIAGRHQADVTGLIGQYAHGNEPDHLVPFLYSYAGAPAKSQDIVNHILDTQYHDGPAGLPGNEDCGQMSAWQILAALGLYQVTPGHPLYTLLAPRFDHYRLQVAADRWFEVTVKGRAEGGRYLASATLNGQPLSRAYLWYREIASGGTLVLELSPSPSSFGVAPSERPFTPSIHSDLIPSPAIITPLTFLGSAKVTMEAEDANDVIWYTLNGDVPEVGKSQHYQGAFSIAATTKLAALVERNGRSSRVTHAEAHALDHLPTITLAHAPNPQYTAGNPSALVDGVLGGGSFSTGRWQGFENEDLVATLDLGMTRDLAAVRVGFIEDSEVYILFPDQVTLETSEDGLHWTAESKGKASDFLEPGPARISRVLLPLSRPVRHLRITAPSRGLVPALGSATEKIKSFLFADEIEFLPRRR